MKAIKTIKSTKVATTIAKKRGRPVGSVNKTAPVAKAAPAKKAVAPKKRGRPVGSVGIAKKVALAPVVKKVAPAPVVKKSVAKKTVAVVAKRGRPAKVVAIVKKAAPAPVAKKSVAPVVVAPKKAGRPALEYHQKVIKSSDLTGGRVPAKVVEVYDKALASKKTTVGDRLLFISAKTQPGGYRFRSLPDAVRQAIREDVVKEIFAGMEVNVASRTYGIAPANIIKWRDEERSGQHEIRPRGRPTGQKNEYRTITVRGKDHRVRIEDCIQKTVKGKTVWVPKAGVALT